MRGILGDIISLFASEGRVLIVYDLEFFYRANHFPIKK